jgi:uncharacterized damage-inducible protein DinB
MITALDTYPAGARLGTVAISALQARLDELGSVLADVGPEIYTARLQAGVSGTIGQHVRHCLDHVSALLGARSWSPLSYDHRERGTCLESDPAEALAQIARLKAELVVWSRRPDEPIPVASQMSTSGETAIGWSSLARELAFVVSHTIHHQAIIAVLLTIHGCGVPARFGYAPSTPRKS